MSEGVKVRTKDCVRGDRLRELSDGIRSRLDVSCDIPVEWVTEYNELRAHEASLVLHKVAAGRLSVPICGTKGARHVRLRDADVTCQRCLSLMADDNVHASDGPISTGGKPMCGAGQMQLMAEAAWAVTCERCKNAMSGDSGG